MKLIFKIALLLAIMWVLKNTCGETEEDYDPADERTVSTSYCKTNYNDITMDDDEKAECKDYPD